MITATTITVVLALADALLILLALHDHVERWTYLTGPGLTGIYTTEDEAEARP